MGDDHHSQGFVGHCWGFDGEAFHSQGCLEITKFDFDLPAFHVEIRDFFGGVFNRIKEISDDDEGGFFTGSIFVTELDIAQGEGGGEIGPLLRGELASGGLLCGFFPGDESFVGADLFSFAPVEFAMTGLVKAHDDVSLFFENDTGDEFVGTEGTISEDEVAWVDVF